MKTHVIREKFLKYFAKHDHNIVPSSSLIPINDPTLLFANAGMNQFKDYFTGQANPEFPRATSAQKCVRAGGKHNDLENVGFTARHHTFFEMLGNFSFGDYFKEQAIEFGWKFLTEELKIPKDKLYVTVHSSDDEAAKIWHEQQNIPKDRIFRLGDKDNFWEMGETGPCGPCSEIFYDHGPQHSDPNYNPKTAKTLLEDETRYIEIWNLVFMQYEKYKEGDKILRRELPKPSVDTGAGLERIAALMQGKYWNYDSDLFLPIFHKLEELSGKKYDNPKYSSSMRVIADHIRSSTMLITDGAIPSNEGRGYVLRRIIRRAVRHVRELGIQEVTLHKLVDTVFETLGKQYPENMANASLAVKLLQIEEKKFLETLEIGMKYLNESLENDLKNNTLPGEVAFKLYDTFGFPLDLTEVILREKNLNLDHDGWEKAMANQRELSRKSQKFSASEDNLKIFYQYKEQFGATKFCGYDDTEVNAKLLAIHQDKDLQALIFDKTPFYGESGGQTGDIGTICFNENFVAEIKDTQKPVDDLFVHYTDNSAILEVGKTYTLKIDENYRSKIAKNHSATHILQAALIEVLGDHVKQAGSHVTSDRLRFDFAHPEALTKEQIRKVEEIANKQIQEHLSVKTQVTSKDHAATLGAMALFGEKYGEKVRVVTMGDFSAELCGGTHVKTTSDIGHISIVSESALASGVRRLEALTSTTAITRLNRRSQILEALEIDLSAKDEKVIAQIAQLKNDLKSRNKDIEQLNNKLQALQGQSMFDNPEQIAKGFVYKEVEAPSDSDLRKLSDIFLEKNDKGIVLLYADKGERLSVLLRTNKKNKDINCSDILQKSLQILNGRAGGKPDLAQGSGEKSDKLSQFKEKIKSSIIEVIERL